MRTETAYRKLYIHETTRLRPGAIGRFVEAFSNQYQPLMEGLGARLFGIWQGNPFISHWPEVTAIWEIDSFSHYGRLGHAHHRDPIVSRKFGQWESLLGELGASGEGRLMFGNRNMKTIAERRAEGFNASVMIQEIMTVKPGMTDEYVEQLEYLYVPWSERTGKLWLGSFTTYLRNEEVIHYWAIEGGWEGFSKFFPAFKDVPPPDFKSWMTVAPALRDAWDDSVLESLPPNPLG